MANSLVFLLLTMLVHRAQTTATENGNSGGAPCVFPFTYGGQSQSKCIMNNHNRPWCGTTNNYDSDKKWGECVQRGCIRTEGGNGGGACCTFPFVYNGQTHHSCIDSGSSSFWCSVSDNYDNDKKWGHCKLGDCIKTTGGNSNGAQCHFPWTYRGQQVNGCVKTNYHKMWCGTSQSYDNDGKWGECVPENNPCNCDPCKNGAQCINEFGNYKCVCKNGFSGRNCEVEDPCRSLKPCKNGAKCVSQSGGSYTCECTNGYTGKNCESDVNECAQNPSPCKNNGVCTNTQGGYTCQCASGFTGKNCESDVNECAQNPSPCKNNAACTNTQGGYTCQCPTGFTGKNCEADVNECNHRPCRNNRRCINSHGGYRCDCGNEYIGKNCERFNPNGLKWYCAVKLHGGVRVKTRDLGTAQRALGHGSNRNKQAIIPMTGRRAGDPHHLSKGWGGGSMWWGGWDEIHRMRGTCERAGLPHY